MLHIKRHAEEQGKTDAHNDAVKYRGGKIDLIISASVEKCVHYGAHRAAKKEQRKAKKLMDKEAKNG